MALVEINFDGLVGPSHNYAGLSFGNLAATANKGSTAYPRAAALQGIGKMRHNLGLGLAQGILLPHPRPNRAWLESLAVSPETADETLRAAAFSASAMWAANAATVSPAPDTEDGRCHLTAANLRTMAHRSHEWPATLEQLRLAFADDAHFAVHDPVPETFGDEGAANHMRLCTSHDAPGIEVFVYGVRGGAFPARQHVEASRALARLNRLDPARTLFVAQSEAAIAAGAFHNDVVAVANERVLFAHEQAFEDKDGFYADLRRLLPEVEIVEVPAALVSLEEAVKSYLFNAQLVTLPEGGPSTSLGRAMALVLPGEARETLRVWTWLETMAAGNGPIRRLAVVDVRESMANGGGPACLRLRVVADPATVDPRFLVDEEKLGRIAALVEAFWPERIAPEDLADSALWGRIEAARAALLSLLDLVELA
ncbi:N-succinylarginine dihydrolase [Sphingosinicella sp. LHD-64]|uniref:N-succinylarginine dihydrolase n=1 Tax=Sphingosinicella sp. LHD-64 TaxID=3072139 RepID=UPI00280E4795|nr:N-succinylarginine dihydrolase [Sphingosinicella sp. LHD-64]MDQ8754949.1 N-succinylarginine dihydrolase [Sphingosinicella sp. LHD-64]